jgi:hypothetical protein
VTVNAVDNSPNIFPSFTPPNQTPVVIVREKEMSKNLHTIQLTDEELYATWAVVTWFDSPVITSKLKGKLAGMAHSQDRPKLEKRFDERITDRIIELGERLPSILEEHKRREAANTNGGEHDG